MSLPTPLGKILLITWREHCTWIAVCFWRVANSHVDSVTPFRSMILSCQRSPYPINIQLCRRFVGYRNSCFLCVSCQRWWAVDCWSCLVTQYCFANFSVSYAKFLQSLKLGTEWYENVPKDRLITIVSRLYKEMNKPFRYTIIHCMSLVNLHTQAWQSILQSLLKRPICVISCVTRICIWKRKKETLQGLGKNMQSKMIFKDHIDRLSTDVRLNNNYNMVCGITFFPRFYMSDFLIQYNTSKNLWDNSSLIWRGFRLISYFGERSEYNPSCLSQNGSLNLRLCKFHSQGDVASLSWDTSQWELVYLCRQVYKLTRCVSIQVRYSI